MISDFRPKRSNARAQKSALISCVKSHTWHLFGKIGVRHCPNDVEVRRRLRLIEARLNKKFLCVAYHKLTETERFRILASFEGVRIKGYLSHGANWSDWLSRICKRQKISVRSAHDYMLLARNSDVSQRAASVRDALEQIGAKRAAPAAKSTKSAAAASPDLTELLRKVLHSIFEQLILTAGHLRPGWGPAE